MSQPAPGAMVPRPVRFALTLGTAAVLVLVPLAAPPAHAARSAPPPAAYAPAAAALPAAPPERVLIPEIGVNAPVRGVGLTPVGTIQTPPPSARNLTGWYVYGPTPGELGPAIILGHVDSSRGPSVFWRLAELVPGDVVKVRRVDGTVAVFTVDGSEQVAKRAFPTERVYGNTDRPALRLITCGGPYDRRTHRHRDNVIVYATLTGVDSG
jgi:sortase (surface protein transpeptidase)